jgi:glutamate-ammonia-ligase adenylyltransferase
LRSPVEEIASIKQKIEQHLTGEADIKLGAGGIRDIEFIVQALMLINAGKNSVLAHNNSLQALNALGTTGLLSSKEKTDLEEAYCFLRKVEHRLQLLHGLQTHSLPETNSELLSLARRMKYRSTKKLLEELNRHREKVRKIFYTVFYTQNDLRRSEDKDGSIGIRTNELMDLKRFRFKELETAHRNFNIISEVLTKFCDLKTLVPLLNALRKFRAPDWGLQNFSMLATSIPIQRTLFVTLLNPKLLEIFAFITSRSRRLTMLLAKEPLLFESLVSQPDELINGNMRWDFLLDSDSIRFKYFSQFTIILQNFFQSLSIRKTAHQLSDVAETILRRKSDEAYNLVFTEKEGFPIAIVAMGKFGGRELSLDSDLDLVFIYDKCDAIKKNLDFQSLAENFSRAVLKNMVSTDRKIYDVDVRLRPEGRNAPLASDIEYLHSYIQGRALLWEKQALLRARVVWGNEELIDKFNRLVQEVLYVDPLPEQWREEIQLMREKIKDERRSTKIKMFDLKTDQGGLIDVEFIVQSLQLIAGRKEIGVRTSNTFEAIDELGKNKVLGTSDAKILARNYKWLRNLELLINLNSEEKLFAWPQSEPLASVIAVGMGEDNKRDLGIQISQIRKQNRRIYSKIISQNIKK